MNIHTQNLHSQKDYFAKFHSQCSVHELGDPVKLKKDRHRLQNFDASWSTISASGLLRARCEAQNESDPNFLSINPILVAQGPLFDNKQTTTIKRWPSRVTERSGDRYGWRRNGADECDKESCSNCTDRDPSVLVKSSTSRLPVRCTYPSYGCHEKKVLMSLKPRGTLMMPVLAMTSTVTIHRNLGK